MGTLRVPAREIKVTGVVSCNLDKDFKLYKYLSLDLFEKWLINNRISLTRVISWRNNWGDNWEAPLSGMKAVDGKYTIINYFGFYNDLFAQSWTRTSESDAMWKIYVPQMDGIKIRTSVSNFKALECDPQRNINLHEIKYYNKLDVDTLNRIEKDETSFSCWPSDRRWGLVKREVFQYEDEVRLLFLNEGENLVPDSEIEGGNYIYMACNLVEFIEEIVMDPRANAETENKIYSLCEESGFDKSIIRKSHLYGECLPDAVLILS